MNYKQFITQLQEAPEIPPVIPAVPYPSKEGTYKGSKYYITATTENTVDEFLRVYLSFLATCKEIALEGRNNKAIQELALKITQGKTSTYDKAKAIHSWVYKNITYQKKPKIVPPWDLIKPEISGDCKSFAVLIASLLGVINIPCWFKLVEIPGYTALHIYNIANLSWEVIDGTGAYPFREVKPVSGYVLFEVDRIIAIPPQPLPQTGVIPSEIKEALSTAGKVAIGAGVVSAIMLGIWAVME